MRGVGASSDEVDRADHVTRFEMPDGEDASVGPAALPEVTQVVSKDVVTGIVQDLVVGDEVDLEVVPRGCAEVAPRLVVRGQPRTVEPPRVIAKDDLV
jgi:hypothetical protein